jgi:sugar lactone lactonase YvrE
MNTKRMNKMNELVAIATMCICFFVFISCGDKDDSGGSGAAYDPSKPVILESFYPEGGKIAEQVILIGENFGSDPDKIRVYFNSKPAKVIGSNGSRMYAVVPRMPGDTCTISVAVGKDSTVYSKTFLYEVSVTVSTVTGTGASGDEIQGGTLADGQLTPFGLCVDDEDNIFVMARYNGGTVMKINERENSVQVMNTTNEGIGWGQSLCVMDGIVYIPSDGRTEVFWTLDPKDGWALKTRYMRTPFNDPKGITTNGLPQYGWKKAITGCPYDGKLYTLYYGGELVKFDPITYEAEVVGRLPQADSYGMAFNPKKPSMLYMSYRVDAPLGHSIYTVDVSAPDPSSTFTLLTGNPSGGHRDGPLDRALFSQPRQLQFDFDGNLYVIDTWNHCVRRITPDDMVETVVGIPGVQDYKNGGKEEATFSAPSGLAVAKDGTVYVGDEWNHRVRKLTIE